VIAPVPPAIGRSGLSQSDTASALCRDGIHNSRTDPLGSAPANPTTGRALDAASPQLNSLILEAEAALAASDQKSTTAALKQVADIVFAIDPFIPDALPGNWHDLLAGWLAGQPMAVLSAIDESASDVVEGAFVYRLTWAIEAIRVRSQANDEGVFSDEPLRSSAALETGSISPQVAILIQAGLASRTAAQIAVEQFPADFVDYGGMKTWLDEPLMMELAHTPWPTETTALVWRDFLEQLRGSSVTRWRRVALQVQVSDDDAFAEPGTRGWLRPSLDPAVAEFLLSDMSVLGRVHFAFPIDGPKWAKAKIEPDGSITAHYTGPWTRQ